MTESITKIVNDFFLGLGISLTSVNVVLADDEANIKIETPDSALLIGMHGKTLEALGHLLGRMIEKISKKYIHIHLEVNDYMKSKDDRLYRFLDSKIAFVTSTGKSIRIPNLNSFERKKAHGYIAEKTIMGLSTYSDGEKTERVLVLEYGGAITPREQTHVHDTKPAHTLEELPEDGVGI
jgi:predicted RNA-binding protein Jag